MRNRISITVPGSLVHTWAINAAMRDIADAAGGSTIVQGQGVWRDNHGTTICEQVHVHHFWYADELHDDVRDAANAAVLAMHNEGEKAVMVETLTNKLDAGQVNEAHIVEAGKLLSSLI